MSKKTKGSRKIGRNKKAINQAESLYARGKITFERYKKIR